MVLINARDTKGLDPGKKYTQQFIGSCEACELNFIVWQ